MPMLTIIAGIAARRCWHCVRFVIFIADCYRLLIATVA
jgi:hypothetical protein